MISTLSMVKLKGINLNMPRPAIQGDARPSGNILVSIDDEGRISLDKSLVAVKDLPDRFTAAIKARPRGAVILKVSDAQKTQALVSTMDLLNETIAETGSSNPIMIATEAAKSKSTGGEK
jgi:biopolymer transport protein ExbD